MIETRRIEHKSNKSVLDKDNERRAVINATIKRRIKLNEHLLKHNQFVTIVMERKISGKRTRGRPCKYFFEEIIRPIIKKFDFISYQQV